MDIHELTERAEDHATETIWWNKGLTKLNPTIITNYDEFLSNLVRLQGPFLEKVQPPLTADQTWASFCSEVGIDADLERVIEQTIFGGGEGRLYDHQNRAIRQILSSTREPNGRDTVLTVPTATGKTECFVIPALQVAIRNKDEADLQDDVTSLIVYPQKALETDQLNRLVEYGYYLNEDRGPRSHITVGIFDGDTPRGAYELYDGQNVRGLQCPVCDEKLEWDANTEALLCSRSEQHDDGQFVEIDFLNLTRDVITERGADVLITNPEAYEFRFFSSDGLELVESDTLDLVIFDEAHVWDGNGGAAISHFIERLRARYGATMVLASATIENPREFATEILRRDESGVAHIDFEPALTAPQRPNDPTVSVPAVPPRETIAPLVRWARGTRTKLEGDAATVAKAIGLVRDGSLTSFGDELVTSLGPPEQWEDEPLVGLFRRRHDLRKELEQRLLEGIPELSLLFREFGEDEFVSLEEALATIYPDVSPAEGLERLDCFLKWCKLADILYDRYHYFIKPFTTFYFCPECSTLHTSRSDTCRHPGHRLYTVEACSNCDTLYYTEGESRWPIDRECSCSGIYDISDQRINATTFLSYLLTQLGRDLKEFGEGKALCFSNRRSDAEGIGSLMRNLDYSLEAQRMIVTELQEGPDDGADERVDGNRRYYTADELQEVLYETLKDAYIDTPYGYLDDELLYKGLSRDLYRYSNPLNENSARRLFQAGLVSIAPREAPAQQKLLMNEIVKALAFKPHTDLERSLSIRRDGLDRKLTNSIEQYMNAAPDVESRVAQALESLEATGTVKVDRLSDDGGVTTVVTLRPKFLRLTAIASGRLCGFCYAGWPFWDRDFCPDCGSDLTPVERGTDTTVSPANGEYDPAYTLDHWGKVIYEQSPYPLVAAVHKAGIDPDTRNKIEEAFSASPPRINVVSATTTLELGIDIGSLDCILNMGIPPTKASYTQRAGRAGRNLAQSSVVFTVANPHSAIDSYYFEDIESRFLNAPSKPIHINTIGDTPFRSQLLSEILTFLNRLDPTYERYERFDTDADIASVLNNVYEGVGAFLEAIGEYDEQLRDHLSKTFDSKSRVAVEQSLNELTGPDGTIRRRTTRRLFKFYSVYSSLTETETTVSRVKRRRVIQEELLSALSRELGYLPMLLSKSGLVAQFRSTDQDAVLFREEGTAGSEPEHYQYESKGLDQAVREAYPEAVDTYAGSRYEVVNVQVSTDQLYQANTCMNTGCVLFLQQQPAANTRCPICEKPLDALSVHEYLGAILKPAYGNKRTRPHTLRGVSDE